MRKVFWKLIMFTKETRRSQKMCSDLKRACLSPRLRLGKIVIVLYCTRKVMRYTPSRFAYHPPSSISTPSSPGWTLYWLSSFNSLGVWQYSLVATKLFIKRPTFKWNFSWFDDSSRLLFILNVRSSLTPHLFQPSAWTCLEIVEHLKLLKIHHKTESITDT